MAARALLTILTILAVGLPASGTAVEVADGHTHDARTLDTIPPRAVTTLPTNGTTNVSVSARILVQFSETMDTLSVEDSLSITHGMSGWTKANGTVTWSQTFTLNDTISFNPFENLPFGENVTVTLNASTARAVDGFYLDGDADNTSEGSPVDDVTWTFQVEASDSTPPSVVAVHPAHGTSAIPETTDIRLDFSEAMNRSTVEDAFLLFSVMRTWAKGNGTFAWSFGSDRATFTPSANLAFATDYTVRIGAASSDLNGNLLDGDGDGQPGDVFLSAFKTRPEPDSIPPIVVNTVPVDGATGVPREPTISISFDDTMSRSATGGAISMVRLNGSVTPVALGPFEWSAADHTISFPAADILAWDTLYRVSVDETAEDDAGLPLLAPYSLLFRTEKWVGGVVGTVVEGTRPVPGATVTIGNATTQTDETGAFAFEGIEAGTYTVSVDKRGFTTLRLTRTLDHSKTTDEAGLSIDLGVIALHRLDLLSPQLAAAVVAVVVLALLAVGLLSRRRRRQIMMHFDDLSPDEAEVER